MKMTFGTSHAPAPRLNVEYGQGGATRDVAKTESEISSHSPSHSLTQPQTHSKFTYRNLYTCACNSADAPRQCAFVLMNMIRILYACVRRRICMDIALYTYEASVFDRLSSKVFLRRLRSVVLSNQSYQTKRGTCLFYVVLY